jgi:protein tyrosine/serine phosphatase
MSDPTANMAGAWIHSDELAIKLSLTRTGQSTTMELDKSQPPTPDGSGRPENFAIVGPGIYRSSYPQHGHFQTLADLGLKTIITLVSDTPSSAYENFLASNGITHHRIYIIANKDPDIFTPAEIVDKVLNLMLDPDNYPLLVHCNKGKHRTGCIVACFRKVTGWTDDTAIEEYEQYSKPKERPLDKEFIRHYDADVLKPLALERRLYRVSALGTADSTKSSVFTTYTTSATETEHEWEGLDEDVRSTRIDRRIGFG